MKKFFIFLLTIFFGLNPNLVANENLPLQLINYKYDLEIPNALNLNISGKNYIRYLKQIKLTSKKDNLNSRVINSTKKRWINSEIKTSPSEIYKVRVKIHGDWNDHISFPYSSLRLKTRKSNYYHQLKEFILFKPVTRNNNAEIFSTIFLQELGFLAPFTKEIEFRINENKSEKYLLQEKINKNFIERSGLREGPIIEYDERHRWNTIKRDEDLKKIKYANIYKLDNETFLENPDREFVNNNKLYMVLSALSTSANLNNLYSQENVYFEVALSLLNACHGLIDHNRKFYFDAINSKFLPIYYDGMAFEKDANFCQNQRLTKNSEFYLEENLIFFEKKFMDKSFKQNIKNNFNKLTIKNNEFENYWSLLSTNFLKFKKKVIKGNFSDYVEKKINLNESNNLPLLQPNYPLIYYYKKNDKNYECFKFNNLKYNNKNLISNTGEIIKLDSKNFCKEVTNSRLVKILKNKIFYTPDIDKDLQIHPTFLTTEPLQSTEKIYLDISKNKKEIYLDANKLYFLYASEKNQINDINLFSNSAGDTTVIFFGELPKINNITYSELNSLNKINTKLQKYNITGCVNFYYVKASINTIKIENSSCEDGINVISSQIQFNQVEINGSVSDGIDMDFSNVDIKKISSSDSDGDCIDLSFGNYNFENVISKDCSDKGISVGENSKVFLKNVEILRNNIGIAIKDSSFVKIKAINVNSENNTCLSLYNKKPEFSDGKLFYEKISKKCLENSQFSEKSIIKKTEINEKN